MHAFDILLLKISYQEERKTTRLRLTELHKSELSRPGNHLTFGVILHCRCRWSSVQGGNSKIGSHQSMCFIHFHICQICDWFLFVFVLFVFLYISEALLWLRCARWKFEYRFLSTSSVWQKLSKHSIFVIDIFIVMINVSFFLSISLAKSLISGEKRIHIGTTESSGEKNSEESSSHVQRAN